MADKKLPDYRNLDSCLAWVNASAELSKSDCGIVIDRLGAEVEALRAENALLKGLLAQINECGQWPELCERCRDEVRALAQAEGGNRG